MTSRFVLPFSDIGSGIAPSDGAKLTFKNPGLETLKNTFSDAAGTIANANPVIADATGLFSNIYIKGSYDVVLQNKNDVQVWADSVSEFALVADTTTVKNFATIIAMTGAEGIVVGDAIITQEASTGNGGGRFYDAVLTSGVTPDADLIIIGVEDALISFVAREEFWPLLYDGSNAAVEMRAGARGALVRSTTTNQATAFNAVPNGTPTGTNKAYSNIRVVAQDIETSPTGTRQFLGMETHFDTDSQMRVRFSTRSEGTPTLKHPDVYWQYNGNNCMYAGAARGGTGLSALSMGFFSGITTFKVDFAPTTGSTTLWSSATAYSLNDEVALLANDYQYLLCTTAGTSGATEPGDGVNGGNGLVGTTGVTDNTAVWTVKSRLLESAADAKPPIWMDEQGNTGHYTMQPLASDHFAEDTLFSKGVGFPATQVPIADPNTLDDYEEGDFTPVLSDGTNDVSGGSSAVQVGKYTKVGRQVSVSGRLVTSSLDSVTGDIRITGLPFTANGVSDAHTAVTTGLASGMAITIGNSVTGFIAASTDYVTLTVWDATTGTTNMQETEWSSNGGLVFSATYFV